MVVECGYCGKHLVEYDSDGNRLTRVDAKFDSDVCRDKYWADVRKIQRAYKRAESAIDLLLEFGTKNNEIGGIATEHLRMILSGTSRVSESD